MARTPSSLYDTDFHAWAMEQARRIRSGESIDIENVAEEIESLGKGTRNKLESLFEIVLIHLLKWQYQPTHRGRSWQLTLLEHRTRIESHMQKNPSLKPQIQEILSDAYRHARIRAAAETGLELTTFPEQCLYKKDEVTDSNWFPS
jgi:hypothetical protein